VNPLSHKRPARLLFLDGSTHLDLGSGSHLVFVVANIGAVALPVKLRGYP